MIDALRRTFSRTHPMRGDALASPSPVQSADRFEEIVRGLSFGVMTFNGNGRLAWLNAAAEEIFGVSRRPVLGRMMIEIAPSIELDRRVRAALNGEAWHGTTELAGQGATRILTVWTQRFSDESGAVLIVGDQTRLHELEQTRRDFISNVAHELRTPLSSIKLMVETLADNPDDEEARNLFLPRIGGEVDRLVDLVEDLLDVARGESGQLVLRRDPLDLAMFASSVLKTFEQRARMLDIALDCSGNSAPIVGDADRLTQVIVNLVDNALRHTHAAGRISLQVEKDEHAARLIVSDSGIGIPYNDLPHIFERFYVVDRSRARESGGTGLGLSIVKRIMEAHGGTIAVDSDFGQGTVFTCTFPL
jgi:two-component system phosphate regulon sensor histidine kinase PhoR